ncbi:MAG: sulfatase-like hydrolase/transferase [Oscillospiraceae bacterium]|nr:sulfatase-like hydrolase/transferase [Oscillospiraceae bacterium]
MKQNKSGLSTETGARKQIDLPGPALFLICSLVWLEMIFLSSVGALPRIERIYILLLFSVSYGLLAFILSSLTGKALINRIIRLVLLFALGLMFCIEYFVFCAFNVLYDLNTILNGAGGAVGGFSKDIILLISSGSGILHILLFFLPFIISLVFGLILKKDRGVRLRLRGLVKSLVLFAAVFLLGLLAVKLTPGEALAYNKEYNYESAVSRFGFLTAQRLEIRKAISGSRSGENGNGGDLEFDLSPVDVPLPTKAPSPSVTQSSSGKTQESGDNVNETGSDSGETVITEPEPIEYGVNALDIDFEALAELNYGSFKSMDSYVASLTPSSKNAMTGIFEGKNLILITAEAFSAEVISPELTPTLYRMATRGINFTDYYQPASAGTTGGEYNILFGMLPSNGGASMSDTAWHLNAMTLGYQLNELGYYGKAFHNNDCNFYDRTYTHTKLGYSEGFMAMGNGMEKFVTSEWPESDLEMFKATVPDLIENQPFNAYYMTVSGHGLYSTQMNAQTRKHIDRVAHLSCSDTLKAYLASQLELEDSMTYLISALEEAGIADDTVIVISADHFPYGLDNSDPSGLPILAELYGRKVDSNLYRDHNRLIIWSGCLEDNEPIYVNEPTFSLDIIPTVLNLFGVDFDSRLLPGRDVFSDALPLVFNLGFDWRTALGTYYNSRGEFVPNGPDAEIPEGYVEAVRTIVRNKINYCSGVLSRDYFRHVFENINNG